MRLLASQLGAPEIQHQDCKHHSCQSIYESRSTLDQGNPAILDMEQKNKDIYSLNQMKHYLHLQQFLFWDLESQNFLVSGSQKHCEYHELVYS